MKFYRNIISFFKQCDDGNIISGDGCNSSCQIEPGYTCAGKILSICQECGNGRVEGTEQV